MRLVGVTFADLDDREQREDRFYSSQDWREGPREAVIEKIEVYRDAVSSWTRPRSSALRRSLAR